MRTLAQVMPRHVAQLLAPPCEPFESANVSVKSPQRATNSRLRKVFFSTSVDFWRMGLKSSNSESFQCYLRYSVRGGL